MTDRLGSVRANGNGERFDYYPYGEEVGQGTTQGRVKFGTYTRDDTATDYAGQRYYGVGTGRFNTADPSTGSSAAAPGSWNRYAYVQGDPINRYDPRGTDDINAGCAAFDDSFCDGSPLVNSDPMNTGVMAPPGMVNVQCTALYGLGYDPMPGVAACTISPEQYQELVGGPAPPPRCSLELEYRPAGITGVLGRTHASLVVQDSLGYTFTIQGEPQRYPLPPWGNLEVSNTLGL